MNDKLKIVTHAGAFGASDSDDSLDSILRIISVAASSDPKMEWAEKYGTRVDNDTFMMHPYCWCEQDDCAWCGGEIIPELMKDFGFRKGETAPNFWHKPTDFKVWWYKYIGRGVETNRKLTISELADVLTSCLDSVKNK